MAKIIDAKNIFIKKQKEVLEIEKRKALLDKLDLFLSEYIGLRVIIADNPIGIALSMMAEISPILSERDYNDPLEWDSFQSISHKLYINQNNKEYLDSARKFILKTANRERPIKLTFKTARLWYHKSSMDFEFGSGAFVTLSEITNQMNKIAEFRERFHSEVGEVDASMTDIDFYLIDDYIRLSVLEDLILKRGLYEEGDDNCV